MEELAYHYTKEYIIAFMDFALMFIINKTLPMVEFKYVINMVSGRSKNSILPVQTDNKLAPVRLVLLLSSSLKDV